MRHLRALIALAALLLAGCGAAAPPAPTLSALAERQTAVAIQGRPTLPPLPTSEGSAELQPQPTPRNRVDVLAIPTNDPRAMGSPAAPVTIYEFTDFECPFCLQFFNETRPQLIKQFVDAGVVRIVARDFPLTQIHPSALIGAVASRCAAGQGKFWPMYESLFSTHGVEWGGVPKRDHAVLIELAGKVGVDTAAFTHCMDDPATERAVLDEAAAAGQLGVNSTPNFLVNGQLVRGALPFASFDQLIRQLAHL
ncbi:MAG: thioredoxin domain-containing protein [Chloroflexales bacterium]